MGDIVTMDDLTNQDIVAVLDDAERLVPVARGDVYLPLLQGKVLVQAQVLVQIQAQVLV